MGSGKLFIFKDRARELKLIKNFNAVLWQYIENNIGAFVSLDTGVCEVENS
jgi:hypothetical protein